MRAPGAILAMVAVLLTSTVSMAQDEAPRVRLEVSTNLTLDHPERTWSLEGSVFEAGRYRLGPLCELPCTVNADPHGLFLSDGTRRKQLMLSEVRVPSSVHVRVEDVLRDFERRPLERAGVALVAGGGLGWLSFLSVAIAGAVRDKERTRNIGLIGLGVGIVVELVGYVLLLNTGSVRAEMHVEALEDGSFESE